MLFDYHVAPILIAFVDRKSFYASCEVCPSGPKLGPLLLASRSRSDNSVGLTLNSSPVFCKQVFGKYIVEPELRPAFDLKTRKFNSYVAKTRIADGSRLYCIH